MNFLPDFLKGQRLGDGARGLAFGAVLTLIAGFGFGGWLTAGGAKEMADKRVTSALVTAYTPVCVQRFMTTATEEQRQEFNKASSWNKDTLLEQAGFATPPGSARPIGDIGDACVKGVEAAIAALAKQKG